MKKPALIGIGNPLREDDAIGIVLLNMLKQKKDKLPDNLEFIDGGTGGMNLLHLLSDFDKVFLVDAVEFNGNPGELRFFQKKDVISKKPQISFSTHENDFLKIINLSEELNESPEDIFIFGIQPKSTNFKEGLTNFLSENLEKYLEQIIEKINILK